MNWIDSFIKPWMQFSDFSSESGRKECWAFLLGNLIIQFLLVYTSVQSNFLDGFVQEVAGDFILVFSEIFQESDVFIEPPVMTEGRAFFLELVFAFILTGLIWVTFALKPILYYSVILFLMLPISFSDGVVTLQVFSLYSLVVLVPHLALMIRRLRNAGYGPLMYLIQLIPFIGSIVFLFLLISTKNRG